MLSGVDLKLLEIFCCVCEEGSFSRAAERLGLTQPTISEHVKTLENYFRADREATEQLLRRRAPWREMADSH